MLKSAIPRALKLNDDGHHLTLAQCALSDSLDFAIINQVSIGIPAKSHCRSHQCHKIKSLVPFNVLSGSQLMNNPTTLYQKGHSVLESFKLLTGFPAVTFCNLEFAMFFLL